MSDPYEIATWRFEQIAPLIDPSLNEREQQTALRERTRNIIDWPIRGSGKPKRKRIARSTLLRWVTKYKKEGYLGLLPKARDDRGRPRTHSDTPSWIQYAIALLYEQPHRSLTQLELYLRLEFEAYSISRSTLSRRLREHPAYR